MSFGRIVGLVLLFMFFEAMVGLFSKYLFETNPFYGCAAMTALAAFIWFVYIATTRWLMRPRLPAPMQAPAYPSADPRVMTNRDPETDEIAKLIREANDTLAKSPRFAAQTSKPTIFDLPLYLTIGADQCGKTTALYHSSTDASLLAGEAHRDLQIIPTRQLNFWFAQNAVFADFAGRLSGEDHNRWMRVLSMLAPGQSQNSPWWKRLTSLASAQPKFRGVVLCCDIGLFIGPNPDPARISAVARQFNERLHGVGAVFGSSFPVYVLFTKVDKVQYFGEFFGRLSDDEERRVIGCTFPLTDPSLGTGDVYAESENKRLGGAFDRLVASLATKRLPFLAREANLRNKPGIYEHPREWRRFRPELLRFLVEAFRPNVLAASPKLRGFYFSGKREVSAASPSNEPLTGYNPENTALFGGTKLFNAGMTQMMSSSAKPPSPKAGSIPRWSFLSQLFNEIILADLGAVPAVAPDARQSLVQRVAFGTAAGVGALAALCFLGSWFNNWRLLSDAQRVADYAETKISRNVTDLDTDRLKALDQLRGKLSELRTAERDGPYLRYRFGLYSGNRAIDPLRSEYFGLFKRHFFTPLTAALVSQFGSSDPTSLPDRIYSYRAMTSGGCKPNEPILSRALPPVWIQAQGRQLPVDATALSRSQIEFYSQELEFDNPYPNQREDTAAVDHARKALRGSGEDIFQQFVQEINQNGAPALLADYAPNYSGVIIGPSKVEAAFTKSGWEAFQAKVQKGDWKAADSCVAGGLITETTQDAQLKLKLTELHVQRYIETWKKFLADSRVDMSGGPPDQARKLKLLGDNTTPLLGLLGMISDHTRFPGQSASLTERGVGVFEGLRDTITPKVPGKVALPVIKFAGKADIARVFQPVHEVISTDDPKGKLVTEANTTYVMALRDFGDTLQNMASNSDSASVLMVQNSKRQALNEVTRLASKFKITDQTVNDNVKRILTEPIDLQNLNLDPNRSDKDAINGAASGVCAKLRPMLNRFPFNAKSEAEVSMNEFNAVFAPQNLTGLRTALARHVQIDRSGVAIATTRELRLPLSLLDLYAHIMRISEGLYQAGSSQPRVSYEARVSTVSAVDSVEFLVDSRKISAAPGKEDSKRFEWTANPDSNVEINVIRGGPIPFGGRTGPWSIFHLMADVDAPNEFNRTRRRGGTPQPLLDKKDNPTAVRLDVTTNSGIDVFARNFFSLRCPVDPVR